MSIRHIKCHSSKPEIQILIIQPNSNISLNSLYNPLPTRIQITAQIDLFIRREKT